MHESSIAEDVLEIITEVLRNDPVYTGKKIIKVHFAQSFPPTVNPDSFEFYFSELIKGTVFDGANLCFEDSDERGFFIRSVETEN